MARQQIKLGQCAGPLFCRCCSAQHTRLISHSNDSINGPGSLGSSTSRKTVIPSLIKLDVAPIGFPLFVRPSVRAIGPLIFPSIVWPAGGGHPDAVGGALLKSADVLCLYCGVERGIHVTIMSPSWPRRGCYSIPNVTWVLLKATRHEKRNRQKCDMRRQRSVEARRGCWLCALTECASALPRTEAHLPVRGAIGWEQRHMA